MNKEDMLEVLDQYFRRRPPLAALMWHQENIAAGETFTVPVGKIYEVYARPSLSAGVISLDGDPITVSGTVLWFPIGGFGTQWVSKYTYDGVDSYDAITTGSTNRYYMASRGWKLSENQVLSCNVAWKIRWRDITDVPF